VISAILQVVTALLGFFKRKPATEMDVEDKINAVQKASSQAGDDVVRATDTDTKLRDYEARDPNNRDNG
jgi:hypothetical protein